MSAELIASALPLACAVFLVRFIAAEAIYQQAVRTRRDLRFPVGPGLRVTLRVGGPFLLFVSYEMMQQVNSTSDSVSALLVALMGMACIVAEPGQITMSSSGLSQTSMLGLLNRTIAWDGATASNPKGIRQVLVIGSNGRTITHSPYHAGQSGRRGWDRTGNGPPARGMDPRDCAHCPEQHIGGELPIRSMLRRKIPSHQIVQHPDALQPPTLDSPARASHSLASDFPDRAAARITSGPVSNANRNSR